MTPARLGRRTCQLDRSARPADFINGGAAARVVARRLTGAARITWLVILDRGLDAASPEARAELRISSAVLVQVKGLGFWSQFLIQSRMSFRPLEWAARPFLGRQEALRCPCSARQERQCRQAETNAIAAAMRAGWASGFDAGTSSATVRPWAGAPPSSPAGRLLRSGRPDSSSRLGLADSSCQVARRLLPVG